MTAEQEKPQLTFEIDSAGMRNTIYLTADASVNDITFTIGATASATFAPAPEVVDPSLAKTVTGSLVYLDLSPLNLTEREFDAISPEAPGWRLVAFPAHHILGMTPDAETRIGPGEELKIGVGALAMTQPAGASASLEVKAYRVDGITLGNMAYPGSFTVALVAPPTGEEPLPPDLVVRLVTPDVVNTVLDYSEVRNQLDFAFLPGDRGRLVNATEQTEFRLSFVYSTDPSGYGALCTPDQVREFDVSAGDNMAGWMITPNLGQQSPYWSIRPPAGYPIVSNDEFSVPWIVIDNVVTTFQPGPTVALMSYTGIEGYADGVFTMLIFKHPHVRIDSLTVQPNPAVLQDDSARVRITWTVQDAGKMELAPFQVDVTGTTGYTATITKTTRITLRADGTHLASMGNAALRNATAEVLPVINSFEALPRSVYAGDLPRYVTLRWNVNTNEQLELLSSAGPPDPARYGKAGEVEKRIPGPRMFTLRSLGRPGSRVVERSVVVSAFAPQTRSWPVPASHLAAPANASFVVASDGDTVTAVDTMVYQPVSGHIPAGEGPAGMAFSASGDTLYVANSRGGTVSAIGVEAVKGEARYEFKEKTRIPVGGSPRRLALSPDGDYLYVTVDRGDEPGLLAVLSTKDGLGPSEGVETGVAPRGLAVTPSGAQIFVANSDDSTVTVVGRARSGRHSYAGTVSGTESACDVAVSRDGDVLLVVCPPLGAVLAFNAVYLDARPKVIRVGASPQQIALVPGGAYAAVASKGDGTMSLLAVGGAPGECRLAAPGIKAGAAPEAIAVTPDAGLVLVGSGAAGLSVVTLAEYETASHLPGIGGQPTNVVISPDGTSVVAWHNAHSTFSSGTPSTGLYVYDIGSGTVTRQLEAVPVVAAAFDPVAANHTVFLAQDKQPAVTVLDSGTWQVTDTIDLAGQTAGLPVALAFTAATLFVLVSERSTRRCELLIYRLGATGPEPAGLVELLTAKAGSVQTLTVASDASRAYVTDLGSRDLLVAGQDSEGGYALLGTPIRIGENPVSAALSPDGTKLFVNDQGDRHGVLTEVDTETLEMRSAALPPKGLISLGELTVSPDGDRLLATDQVIPGVRVFDTASLRLVQTIPWRAGAQMPAGVAVARDGSRIFTANVLSGNLGIVSQVQATAAAEVAAKARPGLARATEPYRGFFVRAYVGQTPDSGNKAGIFTDCCDIWPSGVQELEDPAQTLVAGYGTNAPNVIYTGKNSGLMNYIYVRGKSTVEGASKARVWLYFLDGLGNPSLILWPPQWRTDGMRAVARDVSYIEVPLTKQGDVSFTNPPFGWNLRDLGSGHYCVVAVVENPPLSDPPVDPRQALGFIGSMDKLAAFIASHPNVGWKNTVQKTTAAGQTWSQYMSITGPEEGGLFRAGVSFQNMGIDPFDPSDHDSYFSFQITGPDGKRVGVGKTPLTSDSPTYMERLDWTGYPRYQTDFILNYWAGAKPPPQGATITAVTAISAARLVGLVRDPMAGAFRAPVYRTDRVEDGYTVEILHMVGSVQLNLR